jgi:hypothetical protein
MMVLKALFIAPPLSGSPGRLLFPPRVHWMDKLDLVLPIARGQTPPRRQQLQHYVRFVPREYPVAYIRGGRQGRDRLAQYRSARTNRRSAPSRYGGTQLSPDPVRLVVASYRQRKQKQTKLTMLAIVVVAIIPLLLVKGLCHEYGSICHMIRQTKKVNKPCIFFLFYIFK